jgi:hypothetical protein
MIISDNDIDKCAINLQSQPLFPFTASHLTQPLVCINTVKMRFRINHSHGAASFLKSQSSLSQEIPHLLRNPNVHYHIHMNPSPVPMLSQMNSFSSSFPIYLISILIMSSLETGRTTKVRFPLGVNDISHQSIQPTHPMNTRGGVRFPRVKAAGVLG